MLSYVDMGSVYTYTFVIQKPNRNAMAHQSIKKIMKRYLWGIIATSGFFVALYIMIPFVRYHMIASNEVLDVVTAILFCITFTAGLYYSRFIPMQRYRNIYLFIPLIAFIGFFSEVRLGFHPIIKSYLYQLGIHNWAQMIVIMSLLFALCTIVLVRYLRQFPDFNLWMRYNIPMLVFLMGFIVFFALSITLDAKNVSARRSIVFIEELCEVDMALSLLFCVIYLRSIVNHTTEID